MTHQYLLIHYNSEYSVEAPLFPTPPNVVIQILVSEKTLFIILETIHNPQSSFKMMESQLSSTIIKFRCAKDSSTFFYIPLTLKPFEHSFSMHLRSIFYFLSYLTLSLIYVHLSPSQKYMPVILQTSYSSYSLNILGKSNTLL